MAKKIGLILSVGRAFFLMLLAAGQLFAGEMLDHLDVDGVRYESVKWGTVNQGKMVIFHSRGVATIPLEKLPPEYQTKFGYKPSTTASAPKPPPPVSSPQAFGDWATYNRDRVTKIILDGKLVDKTNLTALTGFLIQEQAVVTFDGRTVRGAVLELAQRRQDTGPVATSMDLRPSLWKRSGETVWLKDYSPAVPVGDLTRVYVTDAGSIDGRHVFGVGREPTFEEWQKLSRR